MLSQIKHDLKIIKKTKPLVLNLTNYVTMDFIANSILAIGAAPIMSVLQDESEELIKISNAININIGTLNNDFISHSFSVMQTTKKLERPIVFDPVGAGATYIRTQTAKKLLPYSNVIKGNASEIIALSGGENKTLGVESKHTTSNAKESAYQLASLYKCIVVVTGKQDFVTDGNEELNINYGHSLMSCITGMGCALSAIIASFCSVNKNYFEACKNAVTYFSLCGTIASQNTSYPGSFRTSFIDQLFKADFNRMREFYDK